LGASVVPRSPYHFVQTPANMKGLWLGRTNHRDPAAMALRQGSEKLVAGTTQR
jgi:hypothetical protein